MIDIVFFTHLTGKHPKHKTFCDTFPFCIFFYFLMIKKIEVHGQSSFNDLIFLMLNMHIEFKVIWQKTCKRVCYNKKLTRNDLFCTVDHAYTAHPYILFNIKQKKLVAY